jgi:hypothetical protein
VSAVCLGGRFPRSENRDSRFPLFSRHIRIRKIPDCPYLPRYPDLDTLPQTTGKHGTRQKWFVILGLAAIAAIVWVVRMIRRRLVSKTTCPNQVEKKDA